MNENTLTGLGYVVSVPSRGAIFLNFMMANVDRLVVVSVPSRGAIFLNKVIDFCENLKSVSVPLGSYIS